MLQQGIDPKIVQERLGHANIPATLHTYSHVLPGLQEAAAQRFDEGLVLSRDEPLASSFRAEAVGRVGGQNLVPGVGFEPTRTRGAADFKSAASAISPPRREAKFYRLPPVLGKIGVKLALFF